MEPKTENAVEAITLTENAVTQLKRIKLEQSIGDDHAIRVGVKGGGCSGFSYILGFDEPQERDEEFDISGMKVIIDKAHAIYLFGIEIDWLDGLNNRGFTFNNPNAKETCGCGTSFSA